MTFSAFRRRWAMYRRLLIFILFFIILLLITIGSIYFHRSLKHVTCNECPASAPCCSKWGYCGSTEEYCGVGCQSGPCISEEHNQNFDNSLITLSVFRCAFPLLNETLLERRLTGLRQSQWLPTNTDEAAIFLSHVSHETDGLRTYEEYCHQTNSCDNYQESWCEIRGKPDQKYYGRGWLQLSYPCNYWNAGKALKIDLLSEPDLVAKSDKIAVASALWYYQATGMNKAAIRGNFAVTTRLLNKYECQGSPGEHLQKERVTTYQRIRLCFGLLPATKHLYC